MNDMEITKVTHATALYEFGPFRIDASQYQLFHNNEAVPLSPKVFETLMVLVENNGRVVGKEEIIGRVWPDTFVEDSSLTQNISLLRKALGEGDTHHRFIETLPKRGYRFIAPVKLLNVEETSPAVEEIVFRERSATQVIVENIEQFKAEKQNGSNGENFSGLLCQVDQPRQRSGLNSRLAIPGLALLLVSVGLILLWQAQIRRSSTASEGGSLSSVRSIAILPLRPLGNDSRDEYLGIGMADSLILKLSRFNQLQILPTSTVLKYSAAEQNAQTAGKELGVQAVLNGTLQHDRDRVRVRLMMISVKDGRSLWSEEFDEKDADIFSLQDAVSDKVTSALALSLSDEQKMQFAKHYTENASAYQSYLMGLYFWNKRSKEGLNKAVEYFQQAVKLDPKYALAYAGLADSYGLMAYYGYETSREETYERARTLALQAVQLDNSIAEPYGTLGLVAGNRDADPKGASEYYRKAISIAPNYAAGHTRYSWSLQVQGNRNEALREMQKAQQLDPVSVFSNVALAQLHYYQRNYDEAITFGRKAAELEPNSFMAHQILGLSYEQKKMFGEAIEEIKKAREAAAGDLDVPDALEALGHIQATAGRKDEARKLLAELEQTRRRGRVTRPFNFVLIYEGLGDRSNALAWLKKAFNEKRIPAVEFRFDPRLDEIKTDPAFTSYVAAAKARVS